jgi:hypothetical protein
MDSKIYKGSLFRYTSPLSQYFPILPKEENPDLAKKEYHIHLKQTNKRQKDFFENTGQDLIQKLAEYIEHHHKDHVTDIGTDSNNDDDYSNQYVWVHIIYVKSDPQNSTLVIETILQGLEKYYEEHIAQFMVPKLVRILDTKLQYPKYIAEAVSAYQSKYGRDRTKDCLHVYFEQIRVPL